jgi:hypothetical protein
MATILESTEDPEHHLGSELHHLNGADAVGPSRLSRAATGAGFWRTATMQRLCHEGASVAEIWKRYAQSSRPKSVARLCRSAGTPLAWGLKREDLTPAGAELLSVADSVRGKRGGRGGGRRRRLHPVVAAWLDEARVMPHTWQLGVGCLASAYLLGEAGRLLDAALAWETLDFLHATALDAAQACSEPSTAERDDAALAELLLAGELPLALSYYFPQMAPMKALRSGARRCLSEGLCALVNDDGLPPARGLAALPSLVACWTRCAAIGGEFNKGCWSAAGQKRYRALVRQTVRWMDADGRVLLADESSDPLPRDMMRAALRLGGRPRDFAAARRLLGSPYVGKQKNTGKVKLPKPSYHCEPSALGILRSEWAASSPIVAVDYSRREMRVDFRAGRRRLFAGAWADESQVGGQPLAAVGGWEELCWFSDKDVDYLEFVLPLEHGARVERQILLGRRDGFLLLVDHLQNPEPADLQHVWTLPLAGGVAWQGEAETRDGLLVDSDSKLVSRALPLALPEWRIDPRMGELTMSAGRLQLAQRTHGRAMACPLFIDLKKGRAAKPCTWRQLTVAESLAIQPADVAVAYRIQCGQRQWLFYRSQAPRANRTVLGQNTSSEFFAARFVAKTGGVEDLVEIQG